LLEEDYLSYFTICIRFLLPLLWRDKLRLTFNVVSKASFADC
jgi:hypothetical protein